MSEVQRLMLEALMARVHNASDAIRNLTMDWLDQSFADVFCE